MKVISFIFGCVLSFAVFAGNCDHHYYNRISPITTEEATTELCYEKYVVMYSNDKRLAIWSAEKLTKSDIDAGTGIKRSDNFHAEKRLPIEYRASLSEYINSGFDRGHLTADRDFPWSQELDSLANIVPQDKILNRGKWASLEKNIRIMAEKSDIFVITGVFFIEPMKTIGNNLLVPSHMYKIVIDSKTSDVKVFVAENNNSATIEQWKISDIERITRIKFFLE